MFQFEFLFAHTQGGRLVSGFKFARAGPGSDGGAQDVLEGHGAVRVLARLVLVVLELDVADGVSRGGAARGHGYDGVRA